MDANALNIKYCHLLNLTWEYRTYVSNWLKSKSSQDKARMDKAKRELDAYLKQEKAAFDSKQQQIF